jgi:hypothetical protein
MNILISGFEKIHFDNQFNEVPKKKKKRKRKRKKKKINNFMEFPDTQ